MAPEPNPFSRAGHGKGKSCDVHHRNTRFIIIIYIKELGFSIVLYSLHFGGLVGVEGRVVERVNRAIISGCFIVYLFTDRDFDDIRLKSVIRKTVHPLVLWRGELTKPRGRGPRPIYYSDENNSTVAGSSLDTYHASTTLEFARIV
jgi:hypothetical protein